MNERYKRIKDEKTVMPVSLALMIARDRQAIGAFDALTAERREEYIRRAGRATEHNELLSVVEDIKTIG